jgi:hypothetical protein
MIKNVKAGLATRQIHYGVDRFWSSQFSDDQYRDGPKNIGLFNIPPPDMAASQTTFY